MDTFLKTTMLTFGIAIMACAISNAQPNKPKAKPAVVAKQPALGGKQLYEKYCLSCHQPDGEGVPNMNPALIGAGYVKGDKKKLIRWVLEGTTKKVPIDGNTYTNNMPSQAYLSDADIATVLTYVRHNFENKYSAVAPAEVKAVRAVIKK